MARKGTLVNLKKFGAQSASTRHLKKDGKRVVTKTERRAARAIFAE
jgi:hypothetical protein